MSYANVNGVNLYYEDHGPRTGPTVILTPGGRNDTNGLRPIAALLSAQCRVILHDRRNCGKSDILIAGELSEQHHWGEEMAEAAAATGRRPRLCCRRFRGLPDQPHPGDAPTRGSKGRIYLGGQRRSQQCGGYRSQLLWPVHRRSAAGRNAGRGGHRVLRPANRRQPGKPGCVDVHGPGGVHCRDESLAGNLLPVPTRSATSPGNS